MVDHEHTRQRFEDHCWNHYMAERERRDLKGDVPDEFPTREQLFWRMNDGRYGVLMFNAAWQAWYWAQGERAQAVQAVPDDFLSHRIAWRQALFLAEERADSSDDAAYWKHEIGVFDNAYSALASAPAAPQPADNWRQYAAYWERTAQEVIERHRDEQAGLMQLLAAARQEIIDLKAAPAAQESADALDAKRYRLLKQERPVLLLTGYFGNGCINRTIDEVDSAIDAAIAAQEASK